MTPVGTPIYEVGMERKYYLRVVAPTNCNPLANAGLIICPASMLPSDLPRLKRVSDIRSQSNSAINFEQRPLTDFVDEANDLSALSNE